MTRLKNTSLTVIKQLKLIHGWTVCPRSDGVAFYIKEKNSYRLIKYASEIESSTSEVRLNEEDTKIFCVIYRPETWKVNYFFLHSEKLFQIINSIKYGTVIFGQFNINTLFESTDSTKYINVLTAFGFKV